ncbi:MAG: helix-turn-helix transcriptional regulator [Deltaproteobacteria bacterium]|jgi:transcriptional regulator with XRE-family HTH domain|nr:helix-turn-helix transcriptional regulator [Deltaproteobacteria bacterium]
MRENTLAKILGESIACRRKSAGITQENFATILGINPETLSRMEKGHFSPKMGRLPDIAGALNCSVADLFRGADVRSSDRASTIAELLKPLHNDVQDTIVEIITLLIKVIRK